MLTACLLQPRPRPVPPPAQASHDAPHPACHTLTAASLCTLPVAAGHRLTKRCCHALANLQVLWKTYGKDLMLAGFFKLMWTVFVIMGGEGRMAQQQPAMLHPAAPRAWPQVVAHRQQHAHFTRCSALACL